MKCENDINSNDLIELTLYLGSVMLMLSEKCKTIDEGIKLCKSKINNGEAFQKFLDLVKLQGGDFRYVTGEKPYTESAFKIDVNAEKDGYLTTLDAYNFGAASIILGCGRPNKESEIDYSAGIIIHKKSGDKVPKSEPICTLYSNKKESLMPAKKLILDGIEIKENKKTPQKRILEYLD
jgi:pyrimidine-nucleoside phosphorylase